MKKEKVVTYLIKDKSIDEPRIIAEERTISYEVEPHFHDFLEIDFVLDGEAYHILNGKEAPFEKGVIVVSRFSDYHYIKPRGEVKLLNVSFHKSEISEKLFHKLEVISSRICIKFDEDDALEAEHLIRAVIRENNSSDLNYEYIGHILESLFIKIMSFDIFVEPSSKSFPIQKALSYLRAHYMEDPPVCDVAKMLHYNEKYFCGIFKSEVGLTYSKYLTKLKINYAKTLLSFTNYDMDYICTSCGFGSMDNFRHTFKKVVGASPFQYRKTNTKNIKSSIKQVRNDKL